MAFLLQDKLQDLRPIALVFAYALGYFIFSQYSAFTNDYLVSDDTGMHSIWMEKYIDGNSFVDQDILVEVSEQIQPTGYYFVHRVLSVLMSPSLYIKLMPFLLFFTSCYFIFLLLNKEFGGKLAALGLVIMSGSLLDPTIGFYARSFAYPLILSFFYFYLEKRYRAAAIVIVLASLFYPSVFLIASTMVGVYHLLYFLLNSSFNQDKTELIALGSAIIVCGIILLIKSHSIESHPMIGEMYSKAEMLKMEALGENGRVKILPQLAPILSMSWNCLSQALSPKLLLLVTLAYIGFLAINRKAITRLDYLLISLLIAGIILFVAARILLFKLFIPIRYLQLTHLIFWHMALIRGLSLVKNKLDSQPILYIGMLAIAIYHSFVYFSPRGAGLQDYSEYAALNEKTKTLRTKILIAGPATVSDTIPFFSERSVFISYESSHLIYYRKYWSKIKQRYFDFYGAYYSSDSNALQALIEKYKLDYIIIDRKYFEGEKEQLFEPISRFIEQNRSGKSINDFAILKHTQQSIIPIDDRFSLLDCSKWLSAR